MIFLLKIHVIIQHYKYFSDYVKISLQSFVCFEKSVLEEIRVFRNNCLSFIYAKLLIKNYLKIIYFLSSNNSHMQNFSQSISS